jgi:hypothetical protein
MKCRVALAACAVSTEGSWSLSKGNETGLRISNLGKGEQVRVDIEVGDLKDHITFDASGLFTLPWKRIERYRVSKIANGASPHATTVEVVLNGSSKSIPRNGDDSKRSDDL